MTRPSGVPLAVEVVLAQMRVRPRQKWPGGSTTKRGLGRDEDAVVLHHCLLTAAKPSPLDTARLAGLRDRLDRGRYAAAAALGAGLPAAEAVLHARAALRAA